MPTAPKSPPSPTLGVPLFTHWLVWADSELAHITELPGAGGWQIRMSAANVGRCDAPVTAPPTGLQGRDVQWGTVAGVLLHAQAQPDKGTQAGPSVAGCLGRIAHGRWHGASGVHRHWWPLAWQRADVVELPPSGAGVLELAFSNGSACLLELTGLQVVLPPDAMFRESMAC